MGRVNEFISLDEARIALGLSEHDLNDLLRREGYRCFREGEILKVKRNEVVGLARKMISGEITDIRPVVVTHTNAKERLGTGDEGEQVLLQLISDGTLWAFQLQRESMGFAMVILKGQLDAVVRRRNRATYLADAAVQSWGRIPNEEPRATLETEWAPDESVIPATPTDSAGGRPAMVRGGNSIAGGGSGSTVIN